MTRSTDSEWFIRERARWITRGRADALVALRAGMFVLKRDERRARKLLGVNQADWRHAKRRAKDGAS